MPGFRTDISPRLVNLGWKLSNIKLRILLQFQSFYLSRRLVNSQWRTIWMGEYGWNNMEIWWHIRTMMSSQVYRAWEQSGLTTRSWLNAHASITRLYFSRSRLLPKRIFSWTVACWIHASWETNPNPSDKFSTKTSPDTLFISDSRAENSELFPQPTFPMTPTRDPYNEM